MLNSYRSTNGNASSVQLIETGALSSLTTLDSTPNVDVYSTVNAKFHALALSLAVFMGFDVLVEVLMRIEGFWRVSTLTWGLQ